MNVNQMQWLTASEIQFACFIQHFVIILMLNPYLISSMLYQEDIWFPDVSMVGQRVHMLESEEEEMWMLVKRNKNIKSVWVRK